MANHPPRYLPGCESSSASTLATSSTAPILPIKRPRSTDSEDGQRKRPRHESQTTSNRGISGNARVMNIGGDFIMHNADDVCTETQAVLESIEQRLKVVPTKCWVDGCLAATDASQNLNAAIRKRQAGTGDWFLDGTEFAEWKETPNIVLCIYGAPGCGKTVLCISARYELYRTDLANRSRTIHILALDMGVGDDTECIQSDYQYSRHFRERTRGERCGDYIMHNSDDFGPGKHAVLESIEQRLKVVDNKELERLAAGYQHPTYPKT
ncbi:hypothetical protein FIBSPDRAFT_1053326 [Athelia psychrophila]|uniref:Nephrocystin 3-like N-terminal domain-containing protein n=1 Tax=Athelia psychrophila TaxID=1759441 RepID=A0A167X507_9AGAM|nr:hypothetical protein FIBSPDRAFT_1053326 [Fibularhizoctonia sp. CBS 109695]